MSEKLALYPERPSQSSESFSKYIEILGRPPEFELSESQRNDIVDFESRFLEGDIETTVVFDEKPKSYAEINRITAAEKKVCLDYFLTEEGKNILSEAIQNVELPDTKNGLIALLTEKASDIGVKEWKSLTVKSSNWAEKKLVHQLEMRIKGDEPEEEPEYFSIIKSPDKLIEKAKYSRELKKYYKAVESDLKSEDTSDPVIQMKLELVRIARERLNLLITEQYRQAMLLQEQSRHVDSNNLNDRLDELYTYLPALQKKPNEKRQEEFRDKAARFLSRIDKFVNGVSSDGSVSPITEDLLRIQERNKEQGEGHTMQAEPGTFSDIDQEVLKSTYIDADEFKKMTEMVLETYGLLSSQEEYDSDREGWATDGKWQVIIDDTVHSLSINGVKGIVRIPGDYNRELTSISPAGPLQVLDHEVTHVLQHQNALKIGLQSFDNVAIPRTSLWAEAGGIYKEQIAKKRILGLESETPATHYLAALQRRIEGGTILDSAQAFYDDSMKRNPETSQADAIKLAVNRTLRLFRRGGELTLNSPYWSNTAPLDYAEQSVLIEQLPEDKKDWLLIGRSNLGVLAQLHRLGWLQGKDFIVPEMSPSEILEPYVRTELLGLGSNS